MGTSVVLLNGSPSSGKTTLATALQAALPYPAFHLSLDEFRSGIRAEFWSTAGVAGLFQAMVRAHLRALSAVAAEGIPVVAESIILPETKPLYDPLFLDFDVTLIGVRCPLPVAQAREAARTDRHNGPVELDLPEFTIIHEQDYALEIDTAAESTQTAVQRILTVVRPNQSTARPSPVGD